MNKVLLATLASAITGVAAAQAPTVLYTPARDMKDQGIGVKYWGSGVISETDETAYEGTHSIRVSTRNFFQGGVMTFSNPVNLSNDFANKANLLKLTFKVAEGGTTSSGGGVGAPAGAGGGGKGGIRGGGAPGGPPGGFPGGFPGGPGGFGGGKGGGGGAPGGFGGGGQGGAPGGFPGAPGQGKGGFGGFGGAGGLSGGTTSASVLKTLRFVITTSDGKKSEVYAPVNVNATGERGWLTVAVPLQAISGLDRTNKQITAIALAGDATTTFYVGDMRIVNDSTPIRGEINQGNLNLGAGEEATLTGYGFGGSSILRYTWDFDDSDGIQVDAEGQTVKRKFRKPGTYTITLTVSDFYGLKQPYTTTIKAVINP
ncbi:PKD domain-containing protein [Fimbriimonas ginsengisoli]|uniref:PKD domain-containing protein n=1 Tax=Fimbriimonas ginsengisoli Gsoil 348 TaxID=661478 RepID=A0A068NP10_FIMGI|nr:PKD domain-containing protein [Fimbriimonas ginsengisoli]AIE85102.1 hypothetical protein OP10G_1734 [Fimbriimonas ginsengisoli Gsoil 348]